MTNEEVILNGVNFEETISEFELLFDEWHNKEFCTMTRIRDYAEYYKEENIKLKAEIEQLKEEAHQIKYRNCLQCLNYGKCSINDNYNISYCSDFELKGQV